MPLYEYHCVECEHVFEKLQKFSDNPRGNCPECGGKGKRHISAPALQFKGKGWYITDYSDKGKPPKGEEGSPSENKNADGSTKKEPSKKEPSKKESSNKESSSKESSNKKEKKKH